MDLNANPSRAGAKAYPMLATIDMTLLSDDGGELDFTLASTPPGLVQPGTPPVISFVGIRQPVLVQLRLVGAFVQEKDIRFVPDPQDAAWFAPGTAPPTGRGTAGGMFKPRALSSDRRELLFRAANPGDGGTYRAQFNFDGSSTTAAARHGGPIIIND